MTATNHVLTGALIGLAVHEPVVAIILAFVSHFVLDSLPHFGAKNHTTKEFQVLLFCDMICATSVLLFLLVVRPDYWALAFFAGIAASSPDLMWLGNWLREMKKQPRKAYKTVFTKFHSGIQRFEKHKYWPVEIVWTFGSLAILAKLVII